MRLIKTILVALISSFIGATLSEERRPRRREDFSKEATTRENLSNKETTSPAYISDPLDRTEFKKRVGDSFPSVYLTVIGIIQAVALGILAANLHETLSIMESGRNMWLLLIRASFSFLMLILVLFEYSYFVGIHKWSPTAWDTAIPFFLGGAEIAPMYLLRNPKAWWISFAVLSFVGTCSFLYTRLRFDRSMFSDGHKGNIVYNLVRRENSLNIFIGFTSSVLCLATSFIYDIEFLLYLLGEIQLESIGFIIFGGLLAWIFKKESRFLRELHEEYGFKI